MAYQAKVYVVQRVGRDGEHGPVIAVKLTHADAHNIAKKFAPARVLTVIADKTDLPNVPDASADRGECN